MKSLNLRNGLLVGGMLLLAACGKEEAPATTDLEAPAVEEPAAGENAGRTSFREG